MQPLEQQSAEDFRDTPHGRQLLGGFRGLLFAPDLEREFRRYLGRQARFAQVLGACLLLIVVAGYHSVEWQLYAESDPRWLRELTLLRLVEMAPGVAILIMSVFHRRVRLVANRLFPLLLVLVGIVAARIDIHYEVSQTELAFRYGAGLLIVCSFFFLGITFWRALISAASIILIDILMAALILSSGEMQVHWISVSYYVLLLTIGAISRYIHEYSQREQFLVRQLLGWVAQHDSLTGLANRRSFDAALRQTLLQARRDGQPLALLLLDLDDFKAYNDCLGHPAGDALIRDFGELLSRFSRRPMDLAARVGGEEFALLLLNCDANSAQAIAAQLLSEFTERAIPHPASAQCGCATTSIGIAMWQSGQTAEQLYQAADAALYQAKRAGKNRYVVR
ncbi:GGDEF domain-containing protein [Stutzerimonas xanthomarina]|uniref:diguanylate cyclase n=2 Tax=Stutzerimonas xanthomarina TaxID=271420 RepID=A0A1M5L0K1_9GAMM|nr:GGDEF domain-containing protein [Stutzerimonas xanthomarina]MCP9337413.1 GGDEF domain-containing protein [Stutzerimonas xanthomarina]SEH50042.1 diguanylate cyclase (GGDEF) domain-containing protein [Stutzerimonas xanthomarina]SHG58568.1 diguanylate cyclase (GGDEF) domain-containing protein [Stutzerimonas xanthomarina DSM 18231]